MPTCPNGHEVDADVAFCRQCGASMTPLTQVTQVARTTVVPPHPPVAAPPEDLGPEPTSNMAVYVLAAAIVLIGLVVIGIALVLGSGNNNSGQPGPLAQPTQTSATSGSSPSPTSHGSASTTATALPAGGTKCPGNDPGGGTYGTIGSETSCGFVQAVYSSYVDKWGLNVPSSETRTVSATSPATGRTYTNIICTSGKPWVICVGGNNNTAHMFFSPP